MATATPARSRGADATVPDGVDLLDVHHRQTVFTLGKLAALISRLRERGLDAESRAMAAEVVAHFCTAARAHHEDEERHVFPRLLAGGDPATVQAVLRLQQDHGWLEEDWKELSPQLMAIADGQCGVDLDTLHAGVEVFIALAHDHMSLEASLIYPEARAKLRASERREMGREMAARRRGRHQT